MTFIVIIERTSPEQSLNGARYYPGQYSHIIEARDHDHAEQQAMAMAGSHGYSVYRF